MSHPESERAAVYSVSLTVANPIMGLEMSRRHAVLGVCHEGVCRAIAVWSRHHRKLFYLQVTC